MVSNEHVWAHPDIERPEDDTPIEHGDRYVAQFRRASEAIRTEGPHSNDDAIVELRAGQDVTNRVLGVERPPAGIDEGVEVEFLDHVGLSGNNTGFGTGRILSVDSEIDLTDPTEDEEIIEFGPILTYSIATRPGDSGAGLYRDPKHGDFEVLGTHFARGGGLGAVIPISVTLALPGGFDIHIARRGYRDRIRRYFG